eukprot:CAMPEP_0172470958 /NCGR_PEP_ID=MMETSP1065-20121228/67567_1 /TAXON_ID=265537 /ORGANISM="Amphiprora paludosa, Strain CCMP125" /LENGTH=133 /DNA_ID=CAMNT_0013229039 /DNA_START=168 /DNA_END=566 /DNA_ORIENTATION=-
MAFHLQGAQAFMILRSNTPQSSFQLPCLRPASATTRLYESPFPQFPGESSSAYMKRLAQIASDPALFEQTVLRQQQETQDEAPSSSSSFSSASNATDSTTLEGNDETTTPQTGYVRAEEWEAQRNAQREDMSW